MKGEGVILEGTRPKDVLEVTLTYRKVTHMYVYYILQKGEQLSPSQEKFQVTTVTQSWGMGGWWQR